MPLTRTAGPLEVIALEDGHGPHFRPRRDVFPDASDEQWAQAEALDPGSVNANGEWLLHFRCFAVRLPDGTILLVDAGIGPVDSLAASWAPVPGELPAELAAAGIDPADVATVVLTHLHTDHIGWAVAGAAGTPYFGNAAYLLQRAELAAISRLDPALQERLIDPLQTAGQLRVVDGECQVGAGVRAVATPGHTPGHQSVLVESDEYTVLITGDLLVHAIQLIEPGLAYAFETDPRIAHESRLAMMRDLARRPGASLATAHLGEPFGYC